MGEDDGSIDTEGMFDSQSSEIALERMAKQYSIWCDEGRRPGDEGFLNRRQSMGGMC